jgi:hypothetical protein
LSCSEGSHVQKVLKLFSSNLFLARGETVMRMCVTSWTQEGVSRQKGWRKPCLIKSLACCCLFKVERCPVHSVLHLDCQIPVLARGYDKFFLLFCVGSDSCWEISGEKKRAEDFFQGSKQVWKLCTWHDLKKKKKENKRIERIKQEGVQEVLQSDSSEGKWFSEGKRCCLKVTQWQERIWNPNAVK